VVDVSPPPRSASGAIEPTMRLRKSPILTMLAVVEAGVRHSSPALFDALSEGVIVVRKHIWNVAIALALTWPLAALADEGRPVAGRDLSGKKICWDDGGYSIYAADGKYLVGRDNQPGRWPRTWSIQSPGVVEINEGYRQVYRQIVVLQDGRLRQHAFHGRSVFEITIIGGGSAIDVRIGDDGNIIRCVVSNGESYQRPFELTRKGDSRIGKSLNR